MMMVLTRECPKIIKVLDRYFLIKKHLMCPHWVYGVSSEHNIAMLQFRRLSCTIRDRERKIAID